MTYIRSPEARVMMTLAFYVSLFCYSLGILTMALTMLTGDRLYFWSMVAALLVGSWALGYILVEKIVEYFES